MTEFNHSFLHNHIVFPLEIHWPRQVPLFREEPDLGWPEQTMTWSRLVTCWIPGNALRSIFCFGFNSVKTHSKRRPLDSVIILSLNNIAFKLANNVNTKLHRFLPFSTLWIFSNNTLPVSENCRDKVILADPVLWDRERSNLSGDVITLKGGRLASTLGSGPLCKTLQNAALKLCLESYYQ